jgi:hypothetical protein
MALRLLGEPPIDIHCGGVDLIFHHESRSRRARATNKPFAALGARRAPLIDERRCPAARQRLPTSSPRLSAVPRRYLLI